MDLPEIEVALELFKLLPTHKPRPEGMVTEMTVEERLAVFEKCCAVIGGLRPRALAAVKSERRPWLGRAMLVGFGEEHRELL